MTDTTNYDVERTRVDIKERRLSAGLTQQELAARADCSLAYVTMLERGLSPSRSNVLPRILRALDAAPATEPHARRA